MQEALEDVTVSDERTQRVAGDVAPRRPPTSGGGAGGGERAALKASVLLCVSPSKTEQLSLHPTMDDFTKIATDIGRQIEDRQQLIRSSSEAEQRKIHSLQDLLQRIGASGDAFDQEDRNAVLLEISKREALLQKIQKEAKRQEEIRRQKEAILLQLHTVLTTRTKVLEQTDEESLVLKEHEALLGFFAQKQVYLMEMLKTKMRELLEAMPVP